MMISQTHSYISPRHVQQLKLTPEDITLETLRELGRMGISMDASVVRQQIDQMRLHRDSEGFITSMVGDSTFAPTITTPSVPTPIQFLQTWLPGFVKVLTAARSIDDILGIRTVGSWEDAEIVQGIVEPAGVAREYGDQTNIPLVKVNRNFERRSIVRAEQGLNIGKLQEERAAKMRANLAQDSRDHCAVSLEIFRNAVGFRGWYNGNNRTFGLLNDPNLLAYLTPTGGPWAGKNFQGITQDLRVMFQTLRTQSRDQIKPEKVNTRLVLPTTQMEVLTVSTDYGLTVRAWIEQMYPKCEVMSAPEFQGATLDGSGVQQDVVYLFAEKIDSSVDGSSDGGVVFDQLVQTKFMTLGVERRPKSYVEDYTNATAGVLCKRPFAVVRMRGV
jgi:hypothetical protein